MLSDSLLNCLYDDTSKLAKGKNNYIITIYHFIKLCKKG